jgi:hypothetical protein
VLAHLGRMRMMICWGAVTEYASHVSERDTHIANLERSFWKKSTRDGRLQVQNQLSRPQLQSARSQQSESARRSNSVDYIKQSAVEFQRRLIWRCPEMQPKLLWPPSVTVLPASRAD